MLQVKKARSSSVTKHQPFPGLAVGNQQIAAELALKERAVKLHFKTIFGKLNVSDRTSAVVTALRPGMLNS